MNKTISDFIDYAHSNMIWFAFNFVLVLMPVIVLALIEPGTDDLKTTDG